VAYLLEGKRGVLRYRILPGSKNRKILIMPELKCIIIYNNKKIDVKKIPVKKIYKNITRMWH
jgi:hypothetical protein